MSRPFTYSTTDTCWVEDCDEDAHYIFDIDPPDRSVGINTHSASPNTMDCPAGHTLKDLTSKEETDLARQAAEWASYDEQAAEDQYYEDKMQELRDERRV